MDNAALLGALLEGPATGVALAGRFGVSRAAVWKRIEQLRRQGVEIEALGQRGYALAHPTPLLSAERLLGALPAAARARMAGLHVVFETDSTQVQAMARPAPDAGIELWLAETQSAGQGRRGKSWVSPPLAGIHCSLNRRFACPVAAMSGFSLACAVMLAGSLRRQGIAGIGLKWPNDLWLDGRKCAGLLVQLRGEAHGPCELTLGFGINVGLSAQAGAAIDQAWTALERHVAAGIDRNRLLAGIVADLLDGFEVYERLGFPAFLADWRALDALAGKDIVLDDGGRRTEGRALGIDDDGALRVDCAGTVRRFHSGEASVRVRHG